VDRHRPVPVDAGLGAGAVRADRVNLAQRERV
jgi:hypothetical protein